MRAEGEAQEVEKPTEEGVSDAKPQTPLTFPVPIRDYFQWDAAQAKPVAPLPGHQTAWSPHWLLDIVRAAVVLPT